MTNFSNFEKEFRGKQKKYSTKYSSFEKRIIK